MVSTTSEPVGAADMRDGFLKRHFQRGLAAHGEDDVAGLHAALVGGRIFDGVTTVSWLFSIVISMPMPKNSPDVLSCISLNSSFDSMVEWDRGIRASPFKRAVHQIGARGFLHVIPLDDVEDLAEPFERIEAAVFSGGKGLSECQRTDGQE